MDITTTWAQHHGAAAVEELIRRHPTANAEGIRAAASRWHATEDLAGFVEACSQAIDSGEA